MNNAQGGYRIIDFNGIDLINEETLNTSIYPIIESTYKSKAFLITNIVINHIEYNSTFVSIKLNNSNYEFEVYGRHISVSSDKITSKEIKESVKKFYNYNISLNDIIDIYIKDNTSEKIKARIYFNIYNQVNKEWSTPILQHNFPVLGTVLIEYDYNGNHYIANGNIYSIRQIILSSITYNDIIVSSFSNNVINTTTMSKESVLIPWGSDYPNGGARRNEFFAKRVETTSYNVITI